MGEVQEIRTTCQICKRLLPDGTIIYQHPKHGIVCQYCPEFEDGGIEVIERNDEDNS